MTNASVAQTTNELINDLNDLSDVGQSSLSLLDLSRNTNVTQSMLYYRYSAATTKGNFMIKKSFGNTTDSQKWSVNNPKRKHDHFVY
jgi:hypothetical protein